jgi:hypothetical protein
VAETVIKGDVAKDAVYVGLPWPIDEYRIAIPVEVAEPAREVLAKDAGRRPCV